MKKYPLIMLCLLLLYSMNLYSQETATVTPVTQINTNADEYAPMVLNHLNNNTKDARIVPWKLFFSRSQAGSQSGKTELRYVELITKPQYFSEENEQIDMITDFKEDKLFMSDNACLSVHNQLGLAVKDDGSYDVQGFTYYNGKLKDIANSDIGNMINDDFGDAFVSHLSFRDKRFVFFTSDIAKVNKIKSKGGYDIWYYLYAEGQGWIGPYNLSDINTEADEIAPVIDINGRYLFFSSNWTKYPTQAKFQGGFDIYYTVFQELDTYLSNVEDFIDGGLECDKVKLIEELVNEEGSDLEKFKINTENDEMFFYRVDKKQAFFCTDSKNTENEDFNFNDSTRNMQIYHVSPIPPYLPPMTAVFKVIDCNTLEPMPNISVNLYKVDRDGEYFAQSEKSDSYGSVFFSALDKGDYRAKPDVPLTISPYQTWVDFYVDPSKNLNSRNYHEIKVGKCDYGDTVRITIFFEQDKWDITPSGLKTLNNKLPEIQKFFDQYPQAFCYVEGHTSKESSREHNCELSGNRAESVMAWLVNKVSPEYKNRFKFVQYGECKPLVNEFDSRGRRIEAQSKLNRRVEIVFLSQGWDGKVNNPAVDCQDCQESGD